MSEQTVGAVRCCSVCGRRSRPGEPCANVWCGRADRWWSVAFAVAEYHGALRAAVRAWKYQDQRGWTPVFGRALAGYLDRHQPWFEDFDLLVPVPAHHGPGARRSWDPVGDVVRAAVPRLGPGWEVAPAAVVKTTETPAMTGRRRAERVVVAEGPLRRALVVPDPAVVSGARVLLVDDVFTGGSTAREVARALMGAGAIEVAVLALARPVWWPGTARTV